MLRRTKAHFLGLKSGGGGSVHSGGRVVLNEKNHRGHRARRESGCWADTQGARTKCPTGFNSLCNSNKNILGKLAGRKWPERRNLGRERGANFADCQGEVEAWIHFASELV